MVASEKWWLKQLFIAVTFETLNLHVRESTLEKIVPTGLIWNTVLNPGVVFDQRKMAKVSFSCFILPDPLSSIMGRCTLFLFLIFINDLPDNIRSSVGLFEDDCILYRNICSIQDCFILQEDLTSLGQWEADWQMKFNVAKCHSMRVTRHQHHKQILFDYSIHNQTLEKVQSAKYLGITISDNMDWSQHISEISSKATKMQEFGFCT